MHTHLRVYTQCTCAFLLSYFGSRASLHLSTKTTADLNQLMDPGARDHRSRSPVRRAGGYGGTARPTSAVPRPPAVVTHPAAVAAAPHRPPPHVMQILDDIMAQLRSLRAQAAERQAAADDVETRLSRIEGILAAVAVAWSTGGAAAWEDA